MLIRTRVDLCGTFVNFVRELTISSPLFLVQLPIQDKSLPLIPESLYFLIASSKVS